MELQQEDLHGAVVTGPFIPTRTWASGLTSCCSATSLTPTIIFHAQGIGSHVEVTCLSHDPSFQIPHCVSLMHTEFQFSKPCENARAVKCNVRFKIYFSQGEHFAK